MLVDLFAFGLLVYMIIPFSAAYFASQYDRSFWKWFIFATFLPVIAHITLLMMIGEKEAREKRRNRVNIDESRAIDSEINAILEKNNIEVSTPEALN